MNFDAKAEASSLFNERCGHVPFKDRPRQRWEVRRETIWLNDCEQCVADSLKRAFAAGIEAAAELVPHKSIADEIRALMFVRRATAKIPSGRTALAGPPRRPNGRLAGPLEAMCIHDRYDMEPCPDCDCAKAK